MGNNIIASQGISRDLLVVTRQLLRFHQFCKPDLLFTPTIYGLKWLMYEQNKNIKASHGIFGRLAGGQLVDLFQLNKASIPNFRFQGGLKVAQIYLPSWGGGGGSDSDYKTILSSQLNCELELSLAILSHIKAYITTSSSTFQIVTNRNMQVWLKVERSRSDL